MIEVVGEFRDIQGMVWGLQQPSILGSVRLSGSDVIDTVELDRRMEAVLGDALPDAADVPSHPNPGAALAHRIAQWTIAIQRMFRIAVSETYRVNLPPAGAGSESGSIAHILLPCRKRAAALAAFRWVCEICSQPPAGAEGSIASGPALDRVAQLLRQHAEPGLNDYYIAEAAYGLRMPVLRPFGRMLQIGAGYRGRLFESTLTDRTSALGVNTARDKRRTAALLRRAGLPGAEHEVVSSAQEAVAAAARLGYPVVVKPADLDRGKGVAADLRKPGQVARAFDEARALSRAVLVEKHVDGFTHRLTVVDGRLVKVAKRVAGGVTGDGVHTVRELVGLDRHDPWLQRRQLRTGAPPLTLDQEAEGVLSQAGLSADHVPGQGAYVRLRRRDNVNAGGRNVAIAPGDVHPDNRALAIIITRLLRLDIAGVDLIIDDVSRSWTEGRALVCEVNAQPQMGTNDTPEIYRDLLRDAIPGGGRIPVTLLMPLAGDLSRRSLRAFERPDEPGEMFACADGLFCEGRRASLGFDSGYHAALAAMVLPDTRSLRFVASPGEILRSGLPIDRVDRLVLITAGAGNDEARATGVRIRSLVGRNVVTIEQT